MDEVLSEAYRLAAAQLRQSEAALLAATSTPLDRLHAFLAAGFTPEFLHPAPLRMRIDLWSVALSHPAIAETERALYDQYRAELTRHLSDLATEATLPRVTAVTDLIMAALDGLWLDWMRRRTQSAVENGLSLCLHLAQEQLAP